MKKLRTVCALILLCAQPNRIQTMDEWTLVCGGLALASGALALSAYGNYCQHHYITTLITERNTARSERDVARRERDARPESVWKGFLDQLNEFAPFLCIKKELVTPEQITLLQELGFYQSQRRHKIASLVTLLSQCPHFTEEEKNLISDEEETLALDEQMLGEIGDDLVNIRLELEKIEGKK